MNTVSRRSIGKLIITLSLLLIFLIISNPLELLKNLQRTNLPTYILGLLIFLSVYPIAGLRWKIMTENITDIRYSDCMKILGMSYGLNKVLPLNSGDIARSKLMEKYVDIENHSQILGLVALERLVDVIIVTSFLLTVVIFYFSEFFQKSSWILIALSAMCLMFIIFTRYKNHLKLILNYIPEAIFLTQFKNILKDALEGFNVLNKRQYIYTFSLTILRWSLDVLAFYIIAASSGYSVSIATAILVNSIMTLISAIPITPAGTGVVELSATGVLAALVYSNSAAATIVILQRSLGVMVMALVGLAILNLEEISFETFR